MSESERWVAVLHGCDWIVEREGDDDDADATEYFIADCGADDEAEALAKSIVSDHNGCLSIEDSEATVPELVAALRDLCSATPFLIRKAATDRAHAILAKTGQT